MHALQQTSFDGPRDLRLITDAPVPEPGPGEILIRVTAAGVNFADLQQATGIFAGGPRPPYIAGIEAAGEIVTVGAGVTGLEPGAGVTGLEPGAHVIGASIAGRAFAEYLRLPASAAVPVPAGWTGEQALGLVVSLPTALAALRPLGRIAAGQTVVIHAAAGATGQAAVLLARHYGATIIATASPEKHDSVRRAGADHVLDSRSPELAAEILELTGGTGADLVLESAGGRTLAASLAATRRVTGRVVVYGLAGGEATVTNRDLVYRHQVHLIGLNIGVLIQAAPAIFGEVMGELFGLIGTGVLGPGRPTTYPLAEGPKALSDLAARTTVGRLALRP
ncbi:zinc-binding dehydrogenase [Actinoplanes sp. L3-i22]|uniref:zinc-binding dehydrogenase n=1 Tax=Actinoplanes sp. L3-i22 TaxID=2836373 RepID=UPI001C78FA62|nr:zinc-binding dehydrogenase [Actinoplanes sp. L3-i22]BCY09979.1 NADPH:quinone reductase [Actinoplanes sp. L3-i22]